MEILVSCFPPCAMGRVYEQSGLLSSVSSGAHLLMASMSTACEGEKEKAEGLCVCLWKMVMFSQRSMQRVSLLDEAKSLKLQMERLQNGSPFEHSSQNQVPSPRMKID